MCKVLDKLCQGQILIVALDENSEMSEPSLIHPVLRYLDMEQNRSPTLKPTLPSVEPPANVAANIFIFYV